MNIYTDPEKFGLRVVGEVEFGSGGYEFETAVVWQDIETAALYAGEDSGCSCPIPFESVGRDGLTKIRRAQDLIDYFDERKAESYRYDPNDGFSADYCATIDAAIGQLILKAGAPSDVR